MAIITISRDSAFNLWRGL